MESVLTGYIHTQLNTCAYLELQSTGLSCTGDIAASHDVAGRSLHKTFSIQTYTHVAVIVSSNFLDPINASWRRKRAEEDTPALSLTLSLHGVLVGLNSVSFFKNAAQSFGSTVTAMHHDSVECADCCSPNTESGGPRNHALLGHSALCGHKAGL